MFKRIRKFLAAAMVPALLGAMSFSGGTVTALAAETASVSVSIPVEINVTGTNVPDKEYKLVIEGVGNVPMPEETVLTVKNGGSASFGPIQYTMPEDYQYRIYQSTEAQANFQYDDTVYLVTVQVINSEDGGLEASIVAGEEGTANKTDSLQFVNTYTSTGGGGGGGDDGGGGSSSGGGGGGGNRTDLTNPDTITITDSTPPAETAQTLPDPGEIIDQIQETVLPLPILPKTGDSSVSYAVLLASVILSGGLAAGLYWKKRKSE